MDSLKSKLKEWVGAGLITSRQEEAVWDYERRRSLRPAAMRSADRRSADRKSAEVRSADFKFSGLQGFLILAALIAGLGAVALIAANWRLIPSFVKLIVYFSALTALALFCRKAKSRLASWFSPLLVFYMIAVLAGIGLVSQIYNAAGPLHQALFFWSVLTFSLMLQARSAFPLHFYLTGLYAAFLLWSHFQQGFSALATGGPFQSEGMPSAVFKAQALPPLLLFAASLPLPPPAERFLPVIPRLSLKRAVFQSWAAVAGLVSLAVLSASPYPFFTEADKGLSFSVWNLFLLGGACAWVFLGIACRSLTVKQKAFLGGQVLSFLLFFFLSALPWAGQDILQWESVRFAALSLILFLAGRSALFLGQNRLFVIAAAAFILQTAAFDNWTLAAPLLCLLCFGFFMFFHHSQITAAFPLPSAKKAFSEGAVLFGLLSVILFSGAGENRAAQEALFGLKGLVFAGTAGFVFWAVWNSGRHGKAQKMLLSLAGGLFAVSSLLVPWGVSAAYQLTSLLLNGSLLSLIAIFALTLQAKGFFILCLGALLGRILLFYFEFAKGLAAAGVALVVCGAALAAAGRLYEKHKDRINSWAERLDDEERGEND